MFLAFVSDAGCLVMGGSRFNISPILADRVISVGVSYIFIRLLKARLTFERTSHHFMMDDRRETIQVIWSEIYNKNARMKKLKRTVKAKHSLVHYLLCKYGFSDMFMKFGNCKPIVGGTEITSNVYNPEEWVICSSTTMKPRDCPRGFYQPTSIRIAVRRDELTPMVRQLIGGFFYVVDHFPMDMQPEYVDSKQRWMILLGQLIFSSTINHGKLYNDIDDHLASLDSYIDNIVMAKLKEIGVKIDDVYQLFAILIETFNDRLLGAKGKISSMYEKELAILPFLLYELSSAITNLYFRLKAASKKDLSETEVKSIMNATLRPRLIFAIRKEHGEVSTIAYSGDNKAFKITSLLVPQSDSNRQNSRKDRAVLDDPSKRLHVSVAEVGGYSNLPKSEPSGRSRLNIHVQTDEKSVVMRNPELQEMLDHVQELIKQQ